MPLRIFKHLEPLERSRIDRVADLHPSLFQTAWHYLKQLMPNRLGVLRWVIKGSIGIAVLYVCALLVVHGHLNDQHARAVEVFKAKSEAQWIKTQEAAKKAAADAKARQIEQAITQQAHANWERWKDQFTDSLTAITCYHGHQFNVPNKVYTITCHVSPRKGTLPVLVLSCNQHICVRSG